MTVGGRGNFFRRNCEKIPFRFLTHPSVGKYTTGDIGLSLPLFDLLIKILPFGLDRRCSGAADLSSEKTQGSFPVVARALVTVLFVSAGAEATIDPRRRRSRRRRRHHLPSPLSLGISVTSARSTYTNLIDTRPDSSRFDSLLSLSLSERRRRHQTVSDRVFHEIFCVSGAI